MPTSLYFLRHGEAAAPDDSKYPRDFDRPLTKAGLREMLCIADGMLRLQLELERIITSPLVRAQQTAEIVADLLNLRKQLVTEERLGCGFDLRKLSATLPEHPGCERVLLVGHEPDFSTLVSELIGGGEVAMKKAGLARVDFAEKVARGRGQLVWLLAPKVLRTLGEK